MVEVDSQPVGSAGVLPTALVAAAPAPARTLIEAMQDGSPPADTELLDTSEPAGLDVSLKHSDPVVRVRYEVVDGQTQSAQNAERHSNDDPADIYGAEA